MFSGNLSIAWAGVTVKELPEQLPEVQEMLGALDAIAQMSVPQMGCNER